MNNNILNRILSDFSFIGEETITGNDAKKIVESIVNELTVPEHVVYAQKYINDCHKDLGFMGSPEYDKQKKIVDDYYAPIIQKEKEEKEKQMYLHLKSKYGDL